VLAKLKSVSIPTISQILRRRGVGNAFLSGVAPRTPLQSLVGRAFTARALPTRQDVAATQAGAASLHRRAFETIRPGDVLVIDARGDVGARVTGDILVADPEGVMAIPRAIAAEVAQAGLEAERKDAFSRGKVEAGHALADAYPLNEKLQAEYEATKARSRT